MGMSIKQLLVNAFKLNHFSKLGELRRMSRECDEFYRKVSRKLDRAMKNRAIGILKQKSELMDFFKRCSEDPLKQRIVEQALRLVSAYINLVYGYSVRSTEVSDRSLKEIEARINYNNRRLGALKSYEAVLELEKTVELDEKLLASLKEERKELERTSARLDYIESTIRSFKHRIISTDSLDPEVEEIENVINEATALDEVLSARKSDRMRL